MRRKEKDSSILKDAYRPNGIYVFSVYGARTLLCANTYPPNKNWPDSMGVAELYSGHGQTVLAPAKLQTRISKNGVLQHDWKTTTLSTPEQDSALYYYPDKTRYNLYILADDSLQVDDVMVVDGRRDNETSILFTYYIRRIARPMRPRLVAWRHDWEGAESRIPPESINRFVAGRKTIEDFTGPHGGDGAIFDEEHIVPTSSFIFFFGRARTGLADSTMEYRIRGGRYRDTSWQRTGHLIMMDGLTGDERYRMEVRYKGFPENTATYSFVTKPYWYQGDFVKWVLGIVLASLILLGLNRGHRRKLAKEKAQKDGLAEKLRNVQLQLNPHFIFNALSSIQALMSRQENDKAHRYLSTFGSLLRNALNSSNQDNTTLDQEVKVLDSYLQLEQLRFQFRYTLSIAPSIQTSTVMIPVMLLQPLVENAVRHGIADKREAGVISILFTQQQVDLLVDVKDNGTGFDPAQPATGYGLKLVKEKIFLINSLADQQAIQFEMASSDAGTTVHLRFKNWLV